MYTTKGRDGLEYDNADTRFRFKTAKDDKGSDRQYRVKVTIDGRETFIPIPESQMKSLFKDWQLGIPGFEVDADTGWLTMDPSLSEREVALINGALGAYYRAGRLNIEMEYVPPLPTEDDLDE